MRNLTSLSIFCFGLVCCLLELLPFLLSAQLLTSSPVSCSEHICLLVFFWVATSSGKFYVSFKTSSSDSNYFWACPIYYVNFLLCFPFSLLFALPFLGELLCPFLVHFFLYSCTLKSPLPLQPQRWMHLSVRKSRHKPHTLGNSGAGCQDSSKHSARGNWQKEIFCKQQNYFCCLWIVSSNLPSSAGSAREVAWIFHQFHHSPVHWLFLPSFCAEHHNAMKGFLSLHLSPACPAAEVPGSLCPPVSFLNSSVVRTATPLRQMLR